LFFRPDAIELRLLQLQLLESCLQEHVIRLNVLQQTALRL